MSLGLTLYTLLTLATGFGGMFLMEWWVRRAYRRGYSNLLAVPVLAAIGLLTASALLFLLFSVHTA